MSLNSEDPKVAGFRHGLYRHYKGGLYRTICLARHHETNQPMVVYVCLERGTVNVRELSGPEGFLRRLSLEGAHVDRFVYIDAGLG